MGAYHSLHILMETESQKRSLIPQGDHEAICVAIRAKKRRGKDEKFLSLEFDVDGKTVFYQGEVIEEVPLRFKALKGRKFPIKVIHTGVNDVRHRVEKISLPDDVVKNEDSYSKFQVTPDKQSSKNSFSISSLDRKLRIKSGIDGVNEFPSMSSFLAEGLSPVQKLERLHVNTFHNMMMFCSKYSRNGYRLHVNKSENDRYVIQVEIPFFRLEEINNDIDHFQECKANTGNEMDKASLRMGRYAEEAFIYPVNCLFEELGLKKRFEINSNIYYKIGDKKVDFTAGLFSFDVKNRHNVENGRAFNRQLISNRIDRDDIFFVHTVTERSWKDEFIMSNDSFAMNIVLMGGVTKALSDGKFRGSKYIEYSNLIDIMDLFKRIAIEGMREEGYY